MRKHTDFRHIHKHETGKLHFVSSNICSNKIKTEPIPVDEKPFKCEICERHFNKKSYLSRHMRIHTGDKPYVCNKCGKGFIERNKLIRHEKSVHIHENKKLHVISSNILSKEDIIEPIPIDEESSRCVENGTSNLQMYAIANEKSVHIHECQTLYVISSNIICSEEDNIEPIPIDETSSRCVENGTSNLQTYVITNTFTANQGALISDEVVTSSKLDDHEHKLKQIEVSNGYTHKIVDGKEVGQREQIPNFVLGNMCSREVKPGPIPTDVEPSKCREKGNSHFQTPAEMNTFFTNHESLTCDEVVNKLDEDKLEHKKKSYDIDGYDDGKEMGKTEHIPDFVSGNMCSQEFEPSPIPTDAISSKHNEYATSHFQTDLKTNTCITNQEPVKCDKVVNKLDNCQDKLEHMGTCNSETHTTDVDKGIGETEHIQTNKKSTYKPFKCKDCGKEFCHESRFQTHILREHSEEKPFECKECGKSFMKEKHLQSHLGQHSGERPFKCDECGKGFMTKPSLKSHMITHSSSRPFQCNICGKTFKVWAPLENHVRTHSFEDQFECDLCGKQFAMKKSLKIHRRVHTGEKTACKICRQEFTFISSLKLHMRTYTGEKPYKCSYCGKHFSRSRYLKVHIKIHTGEKPYMCDECGKQFIGGREMRKHTKRKLYVIRVILVINSLLMTNFWKTSPSFV